MPTNPYLFPVGPMPLAGEDQCGLLVSRLGEKTVAYWDDNWDRLFDLIDDRIGTSDWSTLPRMESASDFAKGHGTEIPQEHLVHLSLPVADLIDHDGFGYIKDPKIAYDIMHGLAQFLEASEQMEKDRSRAVSLEIAEPEGFTRLAGLLGRDGDQVFAYLTQSREMLKRMIATAFGTTDLEGIPWVMGLAQPTGGWIGQATQDLWGTPFLPQIRQRNTEGRIMDVDDMHGQFLALLLEGAPPIARDFKSVKGGFDAASNDMDVTVSRIDL